MEAPKVLCFKEFRSVFVHRSWITLLTRGHCLRSGTQTSSWVRMTSQPSATSTSRQCCTTSESALQNPNSSTPTAVRSLNPDACCLRVPGELDAVFMPRVCEKRHLCGETLSWERRWAMMKANTMGFCLSLSLDPTHLLLAGTLLLLLH